MNHNPVLTKLDCFTNKPICGDPKLKKNFILSAYYVKLVNADLAITPPNEWQINDNSSIPSNN